ncbi:MAG: hydroxyisourate hydrolase [Propionibacteriales bacterium]|nr:hydroxyisourate hydrolase [Propionibacteriales bacterium]
MSISTHVLDAVNGVPAQGMELRLERLDRQAAGAVIGPVTGALIGQGATNRDGRCPDLTDGLTLEPGDYRLRFETAAWFARTSTPTFYPVVELVFQVTDASAHYHVPLLLSPFAYSTYRGS